MAWCEVKGALSTLSFYRFTILIDKHANLIMTIYLSIYGSTTLSWALAAFQFLNPIYSPWDSLDGRSARRKVTTYTQNKRKQTSLPRVEFAPTIPVLERAKTVHALDLAVTVIDFDNDCDVKICDLNKRIIKFC
jgi:hypothetical protein